MRFDPEFSGEEIVVDAIVVCSEADRANRIMTDTSAELNMSLKPDDGLIVRAALFMASVRGMQRSNLKNIANINTLDGTLEPRLRAALKVAEYGVADLRHFLDNHTGQKAPGKLDG